MQIIEGSKNNLYKFQNYSPGSIHIDNKVFDKCMLLEPQHYTPIDLPCPDQLCPHSLDPLIEQYPLTEQIFIGTGTERQAINDKLIQYLHQKPIAVEAMASALLPSIHMILMEEDRNFLMVVYP
tara:strand:- start:1583 stop:1954 length:372 start_codon:yes stop_codon:yes gene_type:complete